MSYANHFQHATHIGAITNQHQFSQTNLQSHYHLRQTLDKLDKGYKQAFSRKTLHK